MRLSPKRQPSLIVQIPHPLPKQYAMIEKIMRRLRPRRVISVEMMVSSLVTLWSFLPSLRLSKCFIPLAVSIIQSSMWIGGF